LLSHYCSSYPSLTTSVIAGKKFYGLQFFTRTLPCFTELHSMFYSQGIKVIPDNIYELLTPVTLSHLIMEDGSVQPQGLVICTNCYTIEDVIRLMNVIMIRYRLECTMQLKRQNKKFEYLIYIRQGSIPLLYTIIISYIHPSMYYKIHSIMPVLRT